MPKLNPQPTWAGHGACETILHMCRPCAGRQADVLTLEHRPCREAVVNRALDRVRQKVAAELGEVPADAAALTWVTDFPMFEWCVPVEITPRSDSHLQGVCCPSCQFPTAECGKTSALICPCTAHTRALSSLPGPFGMPSAADLGCQPSWLQMVPCRQVLRPSRGGHSRLHASCHRQYRDGTGKDSC